MDDVIVVGAGPAGNNAALSLATRGYAVRVMDARRNIGEKLCTGIVGQECLRRFPIDPSLVYKEASSAEVIAPHGDHIPFEATSPQARVIDRVAYVASFANRAQRAGARYHLGTQVRDIKVDAEGVTVVTDEGCFQSRALILAAGFGSPLTRRLGMGTVSDYVTGAQAVVSTKGLSDVKVFLGRNVAPGFFSWLVPTSQDRALAGLLVRNQALAHLDRFIRKQLQVGEIDTVVSKAACWGVPLRPLRHTFRERVLVVGDAAGQVKPTTGGGIYYALLASDIAADTMAEAFAAGDLSASQLSGYQRKWKGLLSRELEVGYSARRMFEALNDQQINSLVCQAGANGVRGDLLNSHDVSFDWHSGFIGKVMGHPVLGGALRLINPLLARLAHSPNPAYAFPSIPWEATVPTR